MQEDTITYNSTCSLNYSDKMLNEKVINVVTIVFFVWGLFYNMYWITIIPWKGIFVRGKFISAVLRKDTIP